MLEDAYQEILSLVKSNENVNFIAISKTGCVTVSTMQLLKPAEFSNIQEALDFIEML